MKGDYAFELLKSIIIAQNKVLLQRLAERHNLDVDSLYQKYLKPDYYLPLITENCTT